MDARSLVELDPAVPVLLLKIGRYPLHAGGVGAARSLGRAGVPVYAITEDRVRAAVAAAGFAYGCAVKDSLSSANDDQYAIARVLAPNRPSLVAFDRVLQARQSPVTHR